MAVATAVIGGSLLAGGLVGGIIAGEQSAEAQEAIAQEQLGIARSEREQSLALASDAVRRGEGDVRQAFDVAKATDEELGELEGLLVNRERFLTQSREQLDRDISLQAAFSPNIKLAQQSIGDILRGQESQALAPERARIKRSRAELRNSLKGQGLPDSFVSRRLEQFDRESTEQLGNLRQQRLGQLGQLGAVLTQSSHRSRI